MARLELGDVVARFENTFANSLARRRETANFIPGGYSRHPLTFGPSPVHPLKRLSQHLGGAQVWAKREDVNSGLAFGGNKVRKLEYIVPDVLASGADTLVSIGGYQSNHTRQVAAVAAHLGLKCRLVQEHWVPWEDPMNDRVGNILLSRMMGADSRLDPAGFDIGIRDSWKNALAEVEASGGKPYPIPAGASEHPLGGLGFANWAFEVAEQERDLGVFFDTIIVCTVTGSTHAGMIAGFAALEDLTGVKRRVIGIDASATLAQTRDQVERIARHTAELIDLGRDLRDDAVDLENLPGNVAQRFARLPDKLHAYIDLGGAGGDQPAPARLLLGQGLDLDRRHADRRAGVLRETRTGHSWRSRRRADSSPSVRAGRCIVRSPGQRLRRAPCSLPCRSSGRRRVRGTARFPTFRSCSKAPPSAARRATRENRGG
mgnify:CR=1 FL=1